MLVPPGLVRLLAGDGPLRALRRADGLATEMLAVLRDTRDHVAGVDETADALVERLDAVNGRLDALDGRVRSLEDVIGGVAADVAVLREDAERARQAAPGVDGPGPIERAKRAVAGPPGD